MSREVDSTDTPLHSAGTTPSNPGRSPNHFASGAERNNFPQNINFLIYIIIPIVYAADSSAEKYMSCQTKSSKLDLMQLERLDACLNIFFLLATSTAENEDYVLTRKRSKPSKLRILMKVVLRCDRGGKWLDGNISRAQISRVMSRVRGWCASKVRWCVGRVYLNRLRHPSKIGLAWQSILPGASECQRKGLCICSRRRLDVCKKRH